MGVSVSILRRWEKEGKLKPIRVGKERRYDYDKLMEFLGQTAENAVAIYGRELIPPLQYLKKK